MFRHILAIIALLPALSSSFAAFATTPAKNLADAPSRPFLYKVWDEDSEIWLLGSIHVLTPNVRWRNEQIDRIIDEMPVVYFEAIADDDTLDATFRHQTDRRVRDLSYKLGPENWDRLQTLVEEHNGRIGDYYWLQPWYAETMLRGLLTRGSKAKKTLGVDATILREARKAGKEIRFLETVEDQLRALAAAPENEAMANLVAFLDEATVASSAEAASEAEHEDPITPLIRTWLSGDARALERVLVEDKRSEAVFDAMFAERNARWVDQIQEIMQGSGKALMVVGAGHLVGKESVPGMLYRAGIKVKRQ